MIDKKFVDDAEGKNLNFPQRKPKLVSSLQNAHQGWGRAVGKKRERKGRKKRDMAKGMRGILMEQYYSARIFF